MDPIYTLSEKIYTLLDDKKAKDLTVLSLKGKSEIADYFIIATGTSTTHIGALADHVEKEVGIALAHKEGNKNGGWLLLDYRDVVIHIFSGEMREYYGLERIWNDALKVNFEP